MRYNGQETTLDSDESITMVILSNVGRRGKEGPTLLGFPLRGFLFTFTISEQFDLASIRNNSWGKELRKSFFLNQITTLMFLSKIFFYQEFDIPLNRSGGFE